MTGLPKRLEDLDKALAALGDETMTLSQLDGFVAGLLVCPDLIAPSEWLARVWGADEEDEPAFDDLAEAQTVIGLIMAHYNDVADTLHRRPGRYGPLFDVHPPTDETFWEFWIEGFETAMNLAPSSWLPVVAAGGEAARSLAHLRTLAGVARRDPALGLDPDQIRHLTEQAPDDITACVTSLAIHRSGPSARPRPKVGRNDPCPCGSGRKYKKCCGAN